MTITRAEIPTRAVPYAFMITPETGYIFLRDFTHTSSRELAAAIGLTTVRQPLRESGRLGAEMLLVATGSATERVCCLTLDLPL